MNSSAPRWMRAGWFGLCALFVGCRIEPAAPSAERSPRSARAPDPSSWGSDVVVLLHAPGFEGARDVALQLCQALGRGESTDSALSASLRRIECDLRSQGHFAQQALLQSGDGRWGAAAQAQGVVGPTLMGRAALEMWLRGSGLQMLDAEPPATGFDPCSEPGSGQATPAAGQATAASAQTPAAAEPSPASAGAETAIAPAPAPEATAPDADAGTEQGADPEEPARAEAATGPLVGLLVRLAGGEFRGAVLATGHGAVSGVARSAIVGERLHVGAEGALLRTAGQLQAQAATLLYEELTGTGGVPPADAILLSAARAEPQAADGLVRVTSRGAVPGRCQDLPTRSGP